MKAKWIHDPRVAAVACAVAGFALFQWYGNATRGYIDTSSMFWWWGFQWFNAGSETEHGILILGLSGWLFWRNLRQGRAESREPGAMSQKVGDGGHAPPAARALSAQRSASGSPWVAATAMGVGLTLHALGFAAQQTRLSILALLVFTWGILRLAGGRRWGGAAAFPLVFLVFAIPWNALDSMGFWLRVWVIDASSALAHAAGIGVVQNGTQLVAPDGRYQYDVVAACSGVRSLTAMAALSLLAGYLNFRTWGRRAALLLLCFPLVYVGNVARISSIVFAAQGGGQVWGERAHEVMGYGVFAIVLGGVLAAVSAMRRWWPEREGREAPADERGETSIAFGRTWWVAGGVLTLAAGEGLFLHHLASLPPRGLVGVVLAADGENPVDLPAFLGTEWIGRRAEVTAVEREILPPDTGYARKNYVAVANPARQVFLSVVLSGRDRTSIHRPELCLVGQGWTITGATEHTFRYPSAALAPMGGHFPATLLRVSREVAMPQGRAVVPQLVAYWFVGGDAVVAAHAQRLALDAWNRIAHARADRWAYVLLQTDAADGEAAALARMQAVLNDALPVFQRPAIVR